MSSRYLDWSSGALAAVRAIRNRRGDQGSVLGYDVLLALAFDTEPNECVLGRILRDQQVWPRLVDYLYGRANLGSGQGVQLHSFELEVERVARSEQAGIVGERHLIPAMGESLLSEQGLDASRLLAMVREAELGPDLPADALAGRWHGMVDANIVIQYEPLEAIDWHEETGRKRVTLWIPGSLLNELDLLHFEGGTRRVRERSARFIKSLEPSLDAYMASRGLDIRPGVNVRLWATGLKAGARDTDHLDSAFTLRSLGVPLHIVTADLGFRARARAWGFDVFTPSDRWLLKPELTPREIETAERLRRAHLEQAPILGLAISGTGNPYELNLCTDPEGGEARDVEVVWLPLGGEVVTARDVRENLDLRLGADAAYRQSVPGTLPPGEALSLALLSFLSPPQELRYGIRAAGCASVRGRLVWSDGGFIAASTDPADHVE